ncbi:transposase [Pseudomonas sp. GM84]|uniref:IS110 family transposase n=1 Tax=Pseudomonas sp. GM84 TaxID=1144340 RepID=UPI00026FCF57|nr:IS110 family transposase [Pseudomonas sp. GM84]EJN39687.1 transposase [Pseudomonas sp. GM84]
MASFLGIDVSGLSLDALVRPEGIKISVPNDSAGFVALEKSLRGLNIKRILLEATGGYEREVMRFLQDAGYKVLRVNPRRARSFADSMGIKAKTDAIDAEVLAHFAEVIPDKPALQISPDRALLRELLQQRDRLVQQRDDDRRRLKQTQSMVVAHFLKANLQHFRLQIKLVEQAIKQQAAILNDERIAQLIQVKGIGLVTAGKLVALLPELGRVESREIASLVGVAPFNHDSGKSVGKRSISGGRFEVRRALYMACLVAVKHNPALKARYEALRGRGKFAKVAIVACMRIFIVRLNAMLRTGTPWRDLALPVPENTAQLQGTA